MFGLGGCEKGRRKPIPGGSRLASMPITPFSHPPNPHTRELTLLLQVVHLAFVNLFVGNDMFLGAV